METLQVLQHRCCLRHFEFFDVHRSNTFEVSDFLHPLRVVTEGGTEVGPQEARIRKEHLHVVNSVEKGEQLTEGFPRDFIHDTFEPDGVPVDIESATMLGETCPVRAGMRTA